MSQRLEFANALRGLAALAVLVSHYLGVFWFSRDVAGALANASVPPANAVPTPAIVTLVNATPIVWGPFGVALFFLISGFVIPYSFTRTGVPGFLVGRVFRIYPLYFAGFTVTLMALLLSGMAGGKPFPYEGWQVAVHYVPGLRDVVGSVGMDGIIWTLEVELKFYVVCALAAVLLRAGSLWTFAIPVVLLAAVAAFHQQPWGTVAKLLAFNAEYMLFMFVGVAFNFLFRRCIGAMGFAFAVSGTLAAFFAGMVISGEPAAVLVSYGAAFIVFSAAAACAKVWPKVRVLTFFADISYPLYVVHGVAGYALLAHLTSRGVAPLVAVACATALSISLAWLLHVLVEMPTHRIGQRLSRRFSQHSEQVSAHAASA